MSSKKRDNLIIYGSLIAAIICLSVGAVDYFKDLSNPSLKNEVKEAIKELSSDEDKKIIKKEVEPTELQNIDKKSIIDNHLIKISDQIKKDDLLTPYIIKSWGKYEISNISYKKKIMDDYYSYIVDIKISTEDPVIPTIKNDKLSTDAYIVISLTFNLLKQSDSNEYVVKSIEA